MILSFSVFKEKILDGTKTQTIRPFNQRQWQRFCNAKKYQLYWHNPRNGGILIKEVEPSEKPELLYFINIEGQSFPIHCYQDLNHEFVLDNQFAQRDGFSYYTELHNWFFKKYGEEMFTKVFMVLRWKPMIYHFPTLNSSLAAKFNETVGYNPNPGLNLVNMIISVVGALIIFSIIWWLITLEEHP